MTLKEFIAEIEEFFSNYTETGDINRISIKTLVIRCLNEMGKNICEKREGFVEIKNSQGNLPETFKSLILALNLEPKAYTIFGDREKAQESFIYRQTIEQPAYFDWVTNEYKTNCNTKIITERIVMNEQPTELYYSPQYLSVVKGFKKDSFDVYCINIHPSIRNAYPHQISINKQTVQTNFKDGKIYIQYNSLPVDEEGEIVIPEYTTTDLVEYIKNRVKVEITQELIAKNKNPTGISQLLPLWMQQHVPLRNAAKSECNWNGLPRNWSKGYKRLLQIETDAFNLPKY